MRRESSIVRRSVLSFIVLAICGVIVGAGVGCDVICALFNLPPEVCNPAPGNTTTQSRLVSIDVKFLGIEDDFFDRIGVDFDFDFNDDAPLASFTPSSSAPTSQPANAALVPSSEVGGQENTEMFVPAGIVDDTYFLPTVPLTGTPQQVNFFPGAFAELQIPFEQDIGLVGLGNLTGGAIVDDPYTGFDAAAFGFAILSDIEASSFLNAAMADARNGILSAPKVMLFDGQPAAVMGTNEANLITGVESAFANEAVASSPSVQTVLSGPSAYIRPTMTSDRSQVVVEVNPIRIMKFIHEDLAISNGQTNAILFPVIQHSQVRSMVSVPDGGTLLLGGIRTAGGQQQRGVPILNRLPYVNRLFANTGVVKDTHRLLIMVTPRIVIQEEDQ